MRTNSTPHVCAHAGSVLSAVLTLGWLGVQAVQARMPEPEVTLTVRVYNYAQVSAGTLATAKEVSRRIFREAGVELRLIDCTWREEERASRPACGESIGSFSFDLRILPRAMTERFRPPAGTMGFALRSDAYVHFDRINRLPEYLSRSPGTILGHVMAHELGHLLLGEEHNCMEGIMSARLHKGLVERADHGRLLFSELEAQRIRERLRAQVQAKR